MLLSENPANSVIVSLLNPAQKSANFETSFSREDWTLFRQLGTLSQKAGVPKEDLPALILKELVDNALDAAGRCDFGLIGPNGFFVEDLGDGLTGTDDEIASVFSIDRPLVSSKLLRLPTRGALGNGLRVVVGGVLASGGSLLVSTRGRTLRLVPQDDGTTTAERTAAWVHPGTRIEVQLGASLPITEACLEWPNRAMALSGGTPYNGKTSAFWYDSDAFFELTQAARSRSVRDLVAEFEGCSGGRAGLVSALFKKRQASSLTREEAEDVLEAMRHASKPVHSNRLGAIGPGAVGAYAKEAGTLTIESARGNLDAEVPFIVEVWAMIGKDAELLAHVNSSPIAARLYAAHEKTSLKVWGAGLAHEICVGRQPLRVLVNLRTPYMPITSDGKEPDLGRFEKAIERALSTAAKRAKRQRSSLAIDAVTQKEVILRHLVEAADKASGEGTYRFSQRQLFYAVRPFVLDALGTEPGYDYFCRVLTDCEAGNGDIPGMYRDPRGTLYHPHLREEIPLGTLSVEQYARPAWTFNKILYSEKEGFFSILRSVDWPERNDCALLTSKGYASRAARDVIDLLGDTDQELLFFCIHDADAAGTMIYQALQQATQARGGRRVRIVNLGLEPDEALEMGLQVEKVDRKGAAPVAAYVQVPWRTWLQGKRVELNAMSTPQFIAWLDTKMQEGGNGKLIPPSDVLQERLEQVTRSELRAGLAEKILAEAGLETQVEREFLNVLPALHAWDPHLEGFVRQEADAVPQEPWSRPVQRVGTALAQEALQERAAPQYDNPE